MPAPTTMVSNAAVTSDRLAEARTRLVVAGLAPAGQVLVEHHRQVTQEQAAGLRHGEVTFGVSGESRANELFIENEGRHRLVHFWYQSHRRTGMLGWFEQAVDHFIGSLLDGRSDGSLVRISTPISGADDIAAARARLGAFGREVMPELRAHWPAERVHEVVPAN